MKFDYHFSWVSWKPYLYLKSSDHNFKINTNKTSQHTVLNACMWHCMCIFVLIHLPRVFRGTCLKALLYISGDMPKFWPFPPHQMTSFKYQFFGGEVSSLWKLYEVPTTFIITWISFSPSVMMHKISIQMSEEQNR